MISTSEVSCCRPEAGVFSESRLRTRHCMQPQQVALQPACTTLCTARSWTGVQRPCMLWHSCRGAKNMEPPPRTKTQKLCCATSDLELLPAPSARDPGCLLLRNPSLCYWNACTSQLLAQSILFADLDSQETHKSSDFVRNKLEPGAPVASLCAQQ